MIKKLIIIFAGTGDTAQQVQNIYEGPIDKGGESFKDDVIRIYFNGCQDERIGGKTFIKGLLSPNLNFIAQKIRQAFSSSQGLIQLNIQKLQQEFVNSIIIHPKTDKIETIKDITLTGFSRGAVSTFATAKTLDHLNIPISILAKEPVPGESRAQTYDKNSQYALNFDLSKCQNITRADVILGTYSKHNKGIENKWFRQMAPKFNPNTQSHIFLTPKKKHMEFNRRAENYRSAFLFNNGLTHNFIFWDEALDRNYQIPKVEQQKFHFGVVGRTQYLPSFKNYILNELQSLYDEKNSCPVNSFDTFKKIETLYALHCAFIEPVTFAKLTNAILENTEKAKGLREFIVELNNIIQFSKEAIKLSTKEEIALRALEQDFYSMINEYLKLNLPSLKDKEHFEQQFQLKVKLMKYHLPSKTFSELTRLIDIFLEENTLTKPHLIKFIDESETCSTDMLAAEHRILDDLVTNAQELALKFFVSSKRQRLIVFEQHKKFLPQWIKTVTDIADIASFLSPKQFEELLELGKIKSGHIVDEKLTYPKIANRVKTINDLIFILETLPSTKHREILFKAVQANLSKQIPIQSQKLKLSQYLGNQNFQENHDEEQMWAKKTEPRI